MKMAWSTQNVWWRNSSAPGTFSGLFPRVRAYADPKPLPQAGGVRHRYTRTPPPRHSPGWLGGTLRAGPGPLIDPHGAHAGPGPTPPIPPLGHPTRHPLLVIWLRKRRLAGHPKNVLKNAVARFDLPAKSGAAYYKTRSFHSRMDPGAPPPGGGHWHHQSSLNLAIGRPDRRGFA